MTEQDWIELGRRAVACRGWRWLPGMLCVPIGGGFPVRYHGIVARNMPDAGGVQYRPDLRDPATLGCLLALVREAWGSRRVGVRLYDDRCDVFDGHNEDGLWLDGAEGAACEPRALVAALESAP